MIPERYSIPFFVMPDAKAIIAPQRSRVLADNRALYEPTSFKSYSKQMFQATQPKHDKE